MQEPYVKSGSAVRCVMRKPAQIASKLVSKYHALLSSPLLPPFLTMLALSLPSDCAVCFVLCLSAGLLRLTCKQRRQLALFSLSLSLLFSSCFLSSSLLLVLYKFVNTVTHTHADTDTERGVDVRSGAQFTVN